MRLKKRYEFARQVRNGTTPNPYIERACPGKPGHAAHLKRCATAFRFGNQRLLAGTGYSRVFPHVARDRESH